MNTYKKNIFFLLLLLLSFNLYSQRETDHWYFGDEAALRFDYNKRPTVLQDSKMSANYGSATISDKNGNLLFYTSGTFVFNKNHTGMENGALLASDNEVLQTSIIIPKPDNENIYFLFTLKITNDSSPFGPPIAPGLYYSIIDMSLNGGLGRVTKKNLLLTSLTSEKLTAVHAKDGKSFWVISFGKESSDSTNFNTFYAYKVDGDGVNKTPVTSEVEIATPENLGALKASPNGEYIVMSNFQNVILANFNSENGIISNGKYPNFSQGSIMAISKTKRAHAVEFSQDSKYFYIESIDLGNNIIFQYETENISERLEVYSSNNSANYMQLAKNGSIYFTTALSDSDGGNYLNEIVPPKTKDKTLATFNLNSVDFKSKKSKLGLPNFIQSYFRTRILTENGCMNNVSLFEVDTYANITAANWDFGDGNTSTEIKPTHIYTSSKNYTVSCTITINNREIFITKNIQIYAPTNFIISNKNIIQCDIDNDGTDLFNLTTIQENIAQFKSIEKMQFYKNLLDAENDESEINNPENYESSGKKEIFVRLYDDKGCFIINNFFIESVFVQLGNIKNIFTCNILDNATTKNLGSFDLNQKRTTIKNNLNLNNDVEVRFYPDSQSAQLKTNELKGNYISETTTIWVRADTSLGCGGIESFEAIVNAIPSINLQETYTICFNPNVKPPVTVSADNSNDRFEWRNSLDNIISTEKDFTLKTLGEFSLTVYKTENGLLCSNKKSFIVENPDKPIFNNINVNTEDETNNIIEINIDGNSNYEFSLDNTTFNGNSTSHTFSNVNSGLRTIYVRDINNCEQPIEINVSVIGFKKFFTPNGDGNNDFWNIKGLNANSFKSVNVRIFNRYGKAIGLITDFNSQGWDGTYNGKKLITNNYWFKAEIVDKDDNLIEESGNFSLIRN